MNKKLNRRDFLSTTAALGAAGIVAPSLLTSCGKAKDKPLRQPGEYYVPGLEDKADDGRELKVGLVGCGGRGSGALENLLEAWCLAQTEVSSEVLKFAASASFALQTVRRMI